MRRLMSARWRHEHRRKLRMITAGVASVALVGGLSGVAVAATSGTFGNEQVGKTYTNGILLPTQQWINPVGTRILDKYGRLLSTAISPNGKYLAALSWNDFSGYLTMFNLQTGQKIQQVGYYPGIMGDGTVAADGPLWSSDGKTLWVSQTADMLRFSVGANGMVASKPVDISLETTIDNLTTGPTTVPDLPSGAELSSDGAQALRRPERRQRAGRNQHGGQSAGQNHQGRKCPAPGGAGRQQRVRVERGRPAKAGEYTNESDGTAIVASRVTGAATTGTVSEVNLVTGKEVKEISVGLEPTAEYLGQDGTLFVANSNDDSISLVNTRTGAVEQTVNVNPLPAPPSAATQRDHDAQPQHDAGEHRAGQRAGGVRLQRPDHAAAVRGLLPTDFYPVAAQYDPAIGKIVVTNDKGIGARGIPMSIDKGPDTAPAPDTVTGPNTYSDTGSLTEFAMPSTAALGGYTAQVFVDNGWNHLLASTPLSGCKAAPEAIPARLGCPSTIKHVFLIIKENRTYDQELGDIGKGNSDPAYAQFGATITPNVHALSDDFALFDNFYDEGTLSADGHNWLVQADANDYIEKEFGAFYRSYPAQGGDALAYQRDGFLWNAAEAAGQSVQDYGEYNNFMNSPANATWSDYYQDAQIMQGQATGTMPVPTRRCPPMPTSRR